MVIRHAFTASLAGFLSMVLLVAIPAAVLAKRVPEREGSHGKPGVSYIFMNLGYSLAAAMAGDYVTAWVAKDNPLIHT